MRIRWACNTPQGLSPQVTSSLMLICSQLVHVSQEPRWTFFGITGTRCNVHFPRTGLAFHLNAFFARRHQPYALLFRVCECYQNPWVLHKLFQA